MLRIVPPTVPRVGRSDEHFPDGFELHLLQAESYRMQRMELRQLGCGELQGYPSLVTSSPPLKATIGL